MAQMLDLVLHVDIVVTNGDMFISRTCLVKSLREFAAKLEDYNARTVLDQILTAIEGLRE